MQRLILHLMLNFAPCIQRFAPNDVDRLLLLRVVVIDCLLYFLHTFLCQSCLVRPLVFKLMN